MPRKNQGVPTIKDVAHKAAVSIGTVSRVLNATENVDATLRDKVTKAIQELGYRPNARAQSFVRERSNVIAFVLSNGIGLSSVYARILLGIEEFCADSGYHLLFTRFRYDADQAPSELQLPSVLAARGMADCVIVGGANYTNLLEALRALGMSSVVLANDIADGVLPAANYVRYDDLGGSSAATQYLIRLGHRDIWFIGDTSIPVYRSMYDGYCAAMRTSGLEPRAHTVALADDSFDNGHAAMSHILEQNAPLSAIVAGSDDIAHGARDALRQHGKDVPRDVSLIGLEQSGGARAAHLTCIHVDMAEVGRQLARMALARIVGDGKDQAPVTIPATIVRRSSCRPLRRDDSMVL
jgi:DNA-binding LacI/PurR family transcriptional regulator